MLSVWSGRTATPDRVLISSKSLSKMTMLSLPIIEPTIAPLSPIEAIKSLQLFNNPPETRDLIQS